MSEVNKELIDKINQALKQFGASEEVKSKEATFKEIKLPQSVNDFYIKNKNYFAFLLGVLYDQQRPGEVIWQIPYRLYKTLGHLDPELISKMSYTDILSLFEEIKLKPRYPRPMAKQTIEAAQKIFNEYGGKVENIWADNPTCAQVQKRFGEFNGIGQKKAAMATKILIQKYGIPLRDRSGLDIAADDLLTRMFKRCGFVNYEDKNLVVSKARELNPDYPGILDTTCWIIARNYCSPTSPNCVECPIGDICPKEI